MKFNPGNLSKVRSKAPWRVLFFGTDEFSLGVLKALHENSLMSSSDKYAVETLHIVHPLTRKLTPVTKYASLCDLLGHEWPMKELSKRHKYDVGVLASFGHLIPRKLIEAFPYGIINVHPSLLPRWRGAAPLHHTILNGDSTTGISIMSIKPKHFDVGPLLKQKKFDVPDAWSTFRLRNFLAAEGGKMIVDVLSHLPEAIIEETPQSSEGITYAHKITQSMTWIDWANQTVDSIDRQYRAFHETLELRTNWEGKVVSLVEMADGKQKPSITLDSSSPPGLPVFDKYAGLLWDGWVAFANLVIKKKMSAESFHNGYLTRKHVQGVTFTSLANNLFDDQYLKLISQPRQS